MAGPEITDHELGLWGLIATLVTFLVGIILLPDFRKAVGQRFKITFPFLPISFLLGSLFVIVVTATAFLHLEDDHHPMPLPIISYLCLICAFGLCYVLFAAPVLAKINILAWQGWELLDDHVGALSGWPWTRFRTLYYFRGISSTTELYDRRRNPFHIIILDVERLAAINEQTKQNLATLNEDEIPRQYPPLLNRILNDNEALLPQGRMNYGVPVRFGFNEVIYSPDIDFLFQSSHGLPSMAKLNLANLHQWAKNQDKPLRLLFWDWSLPTLTMLLCAYKAEEAMRTKPDDIYQLADVYSLGAKEIMDVCAKVQYDLRLFNGHAFRIARVEQLQTLIKTRDRTFHDVIIGFGSMAICNNADPMFALVPREGVLTWVEFASLIEGRSEEKKKAEQAISSVILSLATQTRLLGSQAPSGLPATNEAFQSCALRRSAPLIMKTAKKLDMSPRVPLVMRRLPGDPKIKGTPEGAAIREVWEEAWASLRKELKDPPRSE